MPAGKLIGIGTGPGDPELVTLKALKALEHVDVLAYFAKRGNISNARKIMEPHLPEGIREIALLYPVTTECDRNGEEYRRRIGEFFEQAAGQVRQELDAGRTVAVLSEGDPLFYGSYMHLHVRLAGNYETTVIPGVTAMSGCWSAAGIAMAQGDDVLSVVPGTLPEKELAGRLAASEAVVIMKVGRNLATIKRALESVGRLDGAVYVERGTMEDARTMPLEEKGDEAAPYFSLVLVPGWEARR